MAQTLSAVITRNIACCHTRPLSSSSSHSRLSSSCRLQSRTPSHYYPFSTITTISPVLKRTKNTNYHSADIRTASNTAATAHKKSRGGGSSSSDVVDPFDLSGLEASVEGALDSLKKQITAVRKGGRDATAIEELQVSLTKSGAKTVKLGDVAQVVPRGRVLAVMVGEKEYLKPIISALNKSPNSLAPTTSPRDPLELHIPLPPPTRESRSAIVDIVAKHGEVAGSALSNARVAVKKKLRQLEMSKTVRPDDLHK
ncbi:hypothetical protein MMC29_004731, partial [Sticta canariensis]|nr:hypothetical protein [Sticta canariensis]